MTRGSPFNKWQPHGSIKVKKKITIHGESPTEKRLQITNVCKQSKLRIFNANSSQSLIEKKKSKGLLLVLFTHLQFTNVRVFARPSSCLCTIPTKNGQHQIKNRDGTKHDLTKTLQPSTYWEELYNIVMSIEVSRHHLNEAKNDWSPTLPWKLAWPTSFNNNGVTVSENSAHFTTAQQCCNQKLTVWTSRLPVSCDKNYLN